jgi:group I intron endonuclease
MSLLPNQDNCFGTIYCTTNLVNGKKYIGQHKNSARNKNYIGSGKFFQKSVNKYGIENFQKEILQYCVDKEDLNESEIYWIDYFGAVKSDLFYNVAPGGVAFNKGIQHTEESCLKMSLLKKGRKPTEESIAKMKRTKEIRKHTYDFSISEETKKKISKTLTGRVGATKGRKFSDEHRRKLSESHLGKKPIRPEGWVTPLKGRERSKDVIDKMVLSRIKNGGWIGTKKTELQKLKQFGKNSPVAKSIVQLNMDDSFVKQWDCISDAVRFFKNRSVSRVIHSKAITACGFKWMYLEDYNKLKQN